MGLRPHARAAAGRAPRRAGRPASAPGLASRRAAAATVRQLLDPSARGVTLEQAFDAAAAGLDSRDRAFARAIVTTTLRRLGSVRRVLGALMDRGFPRKCGSLEAVMVTAAAQILFMEAPDHAAVDSAVTLARLDRNAAPFAGLANAVLRKVAARREEAASYDPLEVDTPDWLAARWRAAWGEDTARAIAGALRLEPSLDVTVRGDAGEWAARLDGVTLDLAPAGAVTRTVRLRTLRNVDELPGYAEGMWWVQDAAAALPALLLGVRPGERVADLCAAPGGKTAQLLTAGGEVQAFDRSAGRMQRLAENMRRLGFSPAMHVLDLTEAETAAIPGAPFDAVLLDAPCTATGTIRRHPDVAWTKRPADIEPVAALQARLLDVAVALLKPGGRLVYSTCSLEPEEGEEQIRGLLARNPRVQRLPVTADELPGLPQAITALGDIRTLPSMLPHPEPRLAGLDGFFAARLVLAP
ncbi:RsmB/NOP family class I SAM-dependent RNA methyltransferase [Camelimonas abortus]|uniref:RsmB/NOP family class I SAM-dependent RNA methyltransferase n=1 Tax=Camelimonas abortus TaxID=1017184 RepID=A0ABV7LCY1_9HYPH